MKIRILFVLIICSGQSALAKSDATTAQELMLDLSRQVHSLQAELKNMRLELEEERVHRQTLQKTVAELQSEQTATRIKNPPLGDVESSKPSPALVNLEDQQYDSIFSTDSEVQEKHVLSNPWWENISISGFGAAGYYNTGSAGTRPHGSFGIKEASLFIEADVWKDTSFYLELQTNRLGRDDELAARTGEIYANFRGLELGGLAFGLKVGRIDLPFGEEYLWQDAIDNPLISNSAPFPYGWDEGALLYSTLGAVSWIAAITDGTETRSKEDHSDKSYNFKIFGRPWKSLYLSASFMANGDASESAIEFGGSHFEPVGDDRTFRGVSSSSMVKANLFEIDTIKQFTFVSLEGELSLSAGVAKQNDKDAEFDRSIRWFSIQPYLRIAPKWYTVLRYSEIGTYDDQKGYHFDGKIFAGGNNAFGFGTRRFRRLSLGLGWRPSPMVVTKLEIGKDWYELIDGSVENAENNRRTFLGLEVALGFK